MKRPQRVFSEYTTNITDLKANPNKLLAQAHGEAVAVLKNNTPSFYMVPSKMFEEMITTIEVLQRGTADMKTVEARFRPTRARLDEIARGCAEALANVDADDDPGFEEC